MSPRTSSLCAPTSKRGSLHRERAIIVVLRRRRAGEEQPVDDAEFADVEDAEIEVYDSEAEHAPEEADELPGERKVALCRLGRCAIQVRGEPASPGFRVTTPGTAALARQALTGPP